MRPLAYKGPVRPKGKRGKAIGSGNFIPTEAMVAFARAIMDPRYNAKIASICTQAGVARATYYQWCLNNDFVDWLLKQTNRARIAALARVHATMEHDAIEGPPEDRAARVRAQKTYLERFDKDFRKRLEHSGHMSLEDLVASSHDEDEEDEG